MDRAKLAELRKKKAQQKADSQSKLLESNASIKDAISLLNETLNDKSDTIQLSNQLKDLKDSLTFKDDIERLETALKASGDVNLSKLDDLLIAIGNLNNTDVVTAVNSLVAKIESREISQDPNDFQPVRRVRKVGGKLIFDDDPLPVNVVSSKGGGIQSSLIDNGRLKVVVDGIEIPPIELGTVGLTNDADVRINPATEEGQESIVTAIENIEIPPPVGGATEAEQEIQTDVLEDIRDNQLPNNHEVTVSNQLTGFAASDKQDEQTALLTDIRTETSDTNVNTETIVENQTNGNQVTNERSKLDLIPYAEQLTASDSITPSSGKAIQLVWAQVISDPDNSNGNLVTIGFDGGATLYKVYALGRSAVFTGAADQDLDITLETSEPVTVNLQYREVTP